jgi:hypothetical protein
MTSVVPPIEVAVKLVIVVVAKVEVPVTVNVPLLVIDDVAVMVPAVSEPVVNDETEPPDESTWLPLK